jgi:hypothetical protein
VTNSAYIGPEFILTELQILVDSRTSLTPSTRARARSTNYNSGNVGHASGIYGAAEHLSKMSYSD